MKPETEYQLKQLINKTFNYKGNLIKIESYKQVSDKIVIKTSKRVLNFLESEIQQFISELEQVEEKEKLPTVHVSLPLLKYEKTPIHIKLETALTQMIDKVIDDEKYIAQAEAICRISDSVVNLEKQQLNFLKATNQI